MYAKAHTAPRCQSRPRAIGPRCRNLALHFANPSLLGMPQPEESVLDNASARLEGGVALPSDTVSPTVRRQRLADAAVADAALFDEPPPAHEAAVAPHQGAVDKVQFVGLDELRGSGRSLDEEVSSGEVSPGSAASPFRNVRRLRPTVPHRSPPAPAAAGASPSSFFTRFGDGLTQRRPLVVDILRGDAVEGIARRHSAEAVEGQGQPWGSGPTKDAWVQRLKPGRTGGRSSVGEGGYAASAMSTPTGEVTFLTI